MEIDLKREYELQRTHERALERIKGYASTADKNVAERLGKMYARYWWVQPEITTIVVLNNMDDMMPEIAKSAAKETMASGKTPYTATKTFQAGRIIPGSVQ